MENYVKLAFMHDAFDEESVETAWALEKDGFYELDNLLFYAHGYALGDIIEADIVDGQMFAERKVKESGNSLIRVFFNNKEHVQETREILKAMKCDSEGSNIDRLISVNVPREVDYKNIQSFLQQGEDNGEWEYEEGCISDHHNS